MGQGRILQTDLSGIIREEITLPGAENLRDIKFVDADKAYVVTDSLYYTENGGQDWRGIAGGRSEILGVNSAGQGLATLNVDFCPTDVGPTIDVLLRISDRGSIEAGPQVANLSQTISAAHTFADGTSVVAVRNRIFKLE